MSKLYHHVLHTKEYPDDLPVNRPLGTALDMVYEDVVVPYDVAVRKGKPSSEANVRAAAHAAKGPLIFDIEMFNPSVSGETAADRTFANLPDGGQANEAEHQRCIDRFVEIACWCKDANPGCKIGFAGLPATPTTLGQNLIYPWSIQTHFMADAYPAIRWQFDRLNDGQLVPGRLPRLIDIYCPGHYAENHAINSNIPKDISVERWWEMVLSASVPLWKMVAGGKQIILFLSQHWSGEATLGNIPLSLAQTMTAACLRHGLDRCWWGAFAGDDSWWWGVN
jgi:hypothetical protein